MPASIIDPVSSALHLSLTADDKKQNDLLDNRLISSAKSVLLSKIEFEEAGSYQANHLDDIKSRYIILKQDKKPSDEKLKKDSSSSGRSKQENGLPTPKKVLYPLSSVRLGWDSGWQVGAGMQNVGNTCYLNSTLQALFHVPAFANWLMSESHHAEKCIHNGGCVICGMRKTLVDTQKLAGPIKPWQVYSKLRQICRHLTPGRQEDAHEFLRYLVESMEKAYLEQLGPSAKQLEQWSKESTPLNQILGGYLRSAVRCLECGHVSITFQHFQDLLVDARKASTLDEALDAFFSRERLEDLGYKCSACNKKVSATKQFFVERAPMVLCIALKRFSSTGGKLSKHVQFKTRISLPKYMSHQNGQASLVYRLVSVVTHLGPSQNCGHYTAVGLGPDREFYLFDDSYVRPIPVPHVTGTNAYIMFYELEKPDISNTNKFNGQSSAKSPIFLKKENEENSSERKSSFIGPLLPEKNKENGRDGKSKLALIKTNSLIVDSSKPSTSESSSFKSSVLRNENGTSTSLSSSSNKSVSKPSFLSLPSENAHNGNGSSTSKMNGSKLYTAENGTFNKILPNVLSPSKSNVIRNGSHNDWANSNGETKSNSTEIKSTSTGDYSKNIDNVQNTSVNASNEFRIKNKVPDDKFSSAKVVNNNGNGSFFVKKSPSPLHVSTQNGNKSDMNGTKKTSRLVPYDSESGGENQEDEEEDENSIRDKLSAPKPQQGKEVGATKATVQGWKVSADVPVSLHSPSLNGVVNSKLIRSTEAYNEQPTVVSNNTVSNTDENTSDRRDVVSQLQRMSHRGYGAPVSSWNGTHAQLNRQVFDDKKLQLKRAAEADDEMDRGRQKKMRHNNNYNKYYHNNNNGNNNYNPFQDVQNHHIHWSENNKGGRGGGGGNRFFSHSKNFKRHPQGRLMHNHPRHHSNGSRYHHNHYRKNR